MNPYYQDFLVARYPFNAGNAGVAVNKLDLCFQDTDGSAKPLGSYGASGTLATDQLAIAPLFAGVSHETWTAAQTYITQGVASGSVTIGITPEYIGPMACPSSTWNVGDLVAANLNAGNTALLANGIIKTTNANLAIGYCIRAESTATTTVQVRLLANRTPNTAMPALTGPFVNLTASGNLSATNATVTTLTATTLTANLLKLGVAANLAAAGTAAGNAAAINAVNTVAVVTGANNTAGVILPAMTAGEVILVENYGAAVNVALSVYPATNAAIDGAAANAAVNITGPGLVLFVARTATDIRSGKMAATS